MHRTVGGANGDEAPVRGDVERFKCGGVQRRRAGERRAGGHVEALEARIGGGRDDLAAVGSEAQRDYACVGAKQLRAWREVTGGEDQDSAHIGACRSQEEAVAAHGHGHAAHRGEPAR